MRFTIFRMRFWGEEPPPTPEKTLDHALQLLREHKYRDFESNIDSYLDAFETIFKKSPRRAIRLLMVIEKERPADKAATFIPSALSKITDSLMRLLPAERRDIYGTVLDVHPKAGLVPFLLAQTRDISQFLKNEMGAKLTHKILDHSASQQKEILNAYEDAFQEMLKSVHNAPFITKQLCKAHIKTFNCLPPYLEKARADIVNKATQHIISKGAGLNPNFAEIDCELAKIVGWGISKNDRIEEFKPSDAQEKCHNLTLFRIRLTNFTADAPQNLYILCCAGRNKAAGHKSGIDNGKLNTLLVGQSLTDIQTAFGLMGRSSAERNALNDIAKAAAPISLTTSDDYKINRPTLLSITLHPSFACVSALTVGNNSVDSTHGYSHYQQSWHLQSFQLNPNGQVQ